MSISFSAGWMRVDTPRKADRLTNTHSCLLHSFGVVAIGYRRHTHNMDAVQCAHTHMQLYAERFSCCVCDVSL